LAFGPAVRRKCNEHFDNEDGIMVRTSDVWNEVYEKMDMEKRNSFMGYNEAMVDDRVQLPNVRLGRKD